MADTLDILTLAEAKTALNIAASDTSVDTELAQVVTAASRLVDSIDGCVVKRTVTLEQHPGGTGAIILDRYPVASVTTVTEYASGSPTVLTVETLAAAGTFTVDAASGILSRRSSWTPTLFASGGVAVTYVAGRYDNTAAVDALYKEAAAAAVIHFWQHRGSQSGFASAGGDGAPFGGVPFSTAQLRKKLAAMLRQDPTPSVA